jgi:hypothetical protein
LNEKVAEAELKTINPATEEIINHYEIMTREQINDESERSLIILYSHLDCL